MVAHHSVRLARVMVLDVERITNMSCDAGVSLTQGLVRARDSAYTCTSSGSYGPGLFDGGIAYNVAATHTD